MFLPYQRRWIEDPSPLKLMEKSRQVGMSWATAYRLVSRLSRPGMRYDAWVSSRDAVQARLFLEDCLGFARGLDRVARRLGGKVLGRGSTRQTLVLANGRRVHCLSSNPDAQAGKRGTRVLDEFALHPEPERLYRIAYPGVTWGGGLELISTHRGSANFFHQLVKEAREDGNPKGFSLHRVTLQDAVQQGLLERLQPRLPEDDPRKHLAPDDYLDYVRTRCPDEESWLQEYCCVPAEDAAAFLSFSDLVACEVSGLLQPTAHDPATSAFAEPARSLYVGVDVGRVHDRTVIWALEPIGDLLVTRHVEVLSGETFSRQEQVLDALLRRPEFRRCCIDATGLGRQFAERAAERYGRYRVEGLQLSLPVQETLAYPLRSALEERRLRLPEDDAIRADLRAVRQEQTSAGHPRFVARRDSSGHSDRFWALALPLHAAQQANRHSPEVHVIKRHP